MGKFVIAADHEGIKGILWIQVWHIKIFLDGSRSFFLFHFFRQNKADFIVDACDFRDCYFNRKSIFFAHVIEAHFSDGTRIVIRLSSTEWIVSGSIHVVKEISDNSCSSRTLCSISFHLSCTISMLFLSLRFYNHCFLGITSVWKTKFSPNSRIFTSI